MKDLVKDKTFVFGYIIGFILFVLFNYYDYMSKNMFSCDDCIWSFGFPFRIYQEGGFITIKEILWVGIFADLFIAIIFSFIIGSNSKFIWSKFQERPLK